MNAEPPPPAFPLLQDWTPVTTCLDWEIGQLAYQRRGAQVFTTQEVPNLVNQGGMAAYRTAEVLFAHCRELDDAGALEERIECMELAIGLGLHSVQLLDRFQQVCREQGADYYDRLTWYATDGTPKMLQDAASQGIFERHAGHVVLGRVDALLPTRLIRLDDGEVVDLTGRLRAIVHTYLFSVLPTSVFRRVRKRLGPDDVRPEPDSPTRVFTDAAGVTWLENWSALMARTVLKHAERVPEFTHLSVEEIQRLAASEESAHKLPLVPLYPLIDLDLAFAWTNPDALEEGPELRRIADRITEDIYARNLRRAAAEGNTWEPPAAEEVWILHSAGSMRSLEGSLQAIRPDGYIQYRDYGPSTAPLANTSHLYQHFGPTTASWINHFALDGWLAEPGPDGVPRALSTAPPGEGEAAIKTRLVSRAALPYTRGTFEERFDPEVFDTLNRLIAVAREATDRPDEVTELYRRALQIEQANWMLLAEAGEIAFKLANERELARTLLLESLRINPWYSTHSWNCFGEILWVEGLYDEARVAFERAVHANPEHFRGYLNLSMTYRREGSWARAVEMAAMAIARDVDGAEVVRSKAVLDEAISALRGQRELAERWKKERAAGSR